MQSSLTQKDQAVNEHCNTVSDEYMAIENRVNRKFPTWWSSRPLTYKKNNLYSSCFFFSFLIIFLILITCIYVSNHLAFPVQRSGRTSKIKQEHYWEQQVSHSSIWFHTKPRKNRTRQVILFLKNPKIWDHAVFKDFGSFLFPTLSPQPNKTL